MALLIKFLNPPLTYRFRPLHPHWWSCRLHWWSRWLRKTLIGSRLFAAGNNGWSRDDGLATCLQKGLNGSTFCLSVCLLVSGKPSLGVRNVGIRRCFRKTLLWPLNGHPEELLCTEKRYSSWNPKCLYRIRWKIGGLFGHVSRFFFVAIIS